MVADASHGTQTQLLVCQRATLTCLCSLLRFSTSKHVLPASCNASNVDLLHPALPPPPLPPPPLLPLYFTSSHPPPLPPFIFLSFLFVLLLSSSSGRFIMQISVGSDHLIKPPCASLCTDAHSQTLTHTHTATFFHTDIKCWWLCGIMISMLGSESYTHTLTGTHTHHTHRHTHTHTHTHTLHPGSRRASLSVYR